MRNLWLLFLFGLATGFISEKLFVSSQSNSPTTDDLYLEGRTSGDLPIDDEDGEFDGSGSGSGDYAFTDLTDQEEKLLRFLNLSRTTVSEETAPSQPQPTAGSPRDPPTTASDSQDPSTTEKDTEKTFILPEEETTSVSPTDVPPNDITTTTFRIDISVSEDTDRDNSLDTWDVTTPTASVDDVLVEVDNEIVAKDGRGSRMYEMDSPEEVTSENLWERTEVLAAVIACGVVGFLCAVFLLLLLAYRMKKKDEGSYDLGDTKLSTTTYHKAPTKEFYA